MSKVTITFEGETLEEVLSAIGGTSVSSGPTTVEAKPEKAKPAPKKKPTASKKGTAPKEKPAGTEPEDPEDPEDPAGADNTIPYADLKASVMKLAAIDRPSAKAIAKEFGVDRFDELEPEQYAEAKEALDAKIKELSDV